MTKADLKKLIDAAAGRTRADLVIKNCQIVNVLSGEIYSGEVAITHGMIIGMGKTSYDGEQVFDAGGKYLCPGFIDAHIHIESSYISPEQLGRIIVPRGTTSIVADPHEIANVCGLRGLRYMLDAAQRTKLNIIYAMPSCVPATPFEDAGAILDAEDMTELLSDENFFGLGEFMNAPGIINCDDKALDKILLAKKLGKLIDGHAPNVTGKELNAYMSAGIVGDHECRTLEEMNERIAKGMYVLIREGSACHDLKTLIRGVTPANSRRVLLCSDDRQPKTILELGHMDSNLRLCVAEGLDSVTAIQLATINVAEAFRLHDRGAIKIGGRADLVLLDDLKTFRADKVWIGGELVAENGRYLPEIIPADISSVRGSVKVKNFSVDRLNLDLTSNKVNVIGIEPGGVVTKKIIADVQFDETGDFIFDTAQDICKVAVIERHHETGKIGLGLLGGYGIKRGAIAVSVSHDSHNIIAAGVSNKEIFCAVEALIKMEGGMVLVKGGSVIASIALPIAGLMSNLTGEELKEKLDDFHAKAHTELGISANVEPVMTLTFMSLPVIPEIKLTTRGLFDYVSFKFIALEVNNSRLFAQNESLRKEQEELKLQIVELKHQLAQHKVNEATALWNKGINEDAIKLCNEALDLNPNDAAAYSRRGTAYARLMQYEQAFEDFDKAIELNPTFAMAYNNRGTAYFNQQQYEQAIQDYNRAIELNPGFALAYNNRGEVYSKQGRYERAIQEFDKAIELKPDYADAYFNRAKAHEELGNKKKSKADFAKAKKLACED